MFLNMYFKQVLEVKSKPQSFLSLSSVSTWHSPNIGWSSLISEHSVALHGDVKYYCLFVV